MYWSIYKKGKPSVLVENDIYKCASTPTHKCSVDASKGQKNLFNWVVSSSTADIDKAEVTKGDLLFAEFFIEHDLPLATADHVGIYLQSILWS